MKRICPTCFTELPEEANYCPTCGKCMREVEEHIIQYTGAAPQTKAVSIKDCAASIGDFEEKRRRGDEMTDRALITLLSIAVLLTAIGQMSIVTKMERLWVRQQQLQQQLETMRKRLGGDMPGGKRRNG